jgi:hypothetical protein
LQREALGKCLQSIPNSGKAIILFTFAAFYDDAEKFLLTFFKLPDEEETCPALAACPSLSGHQPHEIK